MKYKILIDGISLFPPITGIGRYTYEVSKNIEKNTDFKVNYFYVYYSKRLISNSSNKMNLKKILTKINFIKRIIRKLLIFSTKLYTPSFDLYWQPNFIPHDGIKSKKIVTTVHDFSFILYKDFHPKERIEYFEKYFFKSVMQSDLIITGSEFTKNEIIKYLSYPKDKIKVIYHGINNEIFKVYNNFELSIDIPERFIFSVGSIEPRKNLLGLLKAYNNLSKDIKDEYKLVIAGFKGWENKEIMELINRNKSYIKYIGFVSDIELAKIYNLASCFIFPSYYEGFGLPIIEAMSCGTPVICSNNSSLKEIGKDSVLFCDPFCIDDIKDKLILLLSDKELQFDLSLKGLNRAKSFSWEKSADEHIKLFNEVLKS